MDIGECPKFQPQVARGVERVTQARESPSPSPPQQQNDPDGAWI